MTSLKELKALAEAAIQIEIEYKKNKEGLGVYGLSLAIQAKREALRTYHKAAVQPSTILTLISALEKYEEALKTAREYLSTINDCAKHCDPSCNWHTPECGMEQSFYKALTQVQKIMEGK